MSSSHSTMTPPNSRSTTPFTDVSTDVADEYEWVKVHKPKGESDTEFRKNDTVCSAISSSCSGDGCKHSLKVSVDLTIHMKSHTSSSSWSDGYAQTVRTNSPANCGHRTRPSSPLRGSSMVQYNDGVQSHPENHPGTGSDSEAQICSESRSGCAAISNLDKSAAISGNEVTKIIFTDHETGEERVIPVSSASIMSQLGLPIMEIKRVGDSVAPAEKRGHDAEGRAHNTTTLDGQFHQENQPGVECESTDQCSTKPSLGCFVNPAPVKSAGLYEDEMSRMIITDEITGEESVIEVYPVDVVTRRY